MVKRRHAPQSRDVCQPPAQNLKRLLPWAAQRCVEAYRIYDRDIPESPAGRRSLYADTLVVYPYAYSTELTDEEQAEQDSFHDELIETLSTLTGVPRERIFKKERKRQKGSAQYERLGESKHEMVVHENGHRFW